MKDKKVSLSEISEAREIQKKSDRPHLGLRDVELFDEIGFQKIVVDDYIQLLQNAMQHIEMELDIPIEGLFFAFTRYSQLASELEDRLEDELREHK